MTATSRPHRPHILPCVLLAALALGSGCKRGGPGTTGPDGRPPATPGKGCSAWASAPTRSVKFLDGRIRVALPPDFVVEPEAETNLMAAPTSLQRRSSVVAAVPGTRDAELVLVGFELFASRPPSMAPYLDLVGGFVGHSGPMRALEVTPASGTELWAFRPPSFTEVEGTTTVGAALVDLGDGLLVFVGLGVTGSGTDVDLDGCSAFASQTLASIEAGSRQPDWTQASSLRIPTPGRQRLVVERPAGWGAFTNRMYDHTVTYLMELAPLWSDRRPANVTIYVGRHGDTTPPVGAAVLPRTIAGLETNWHLLRKEERSYGFARLYGPLGEDRLIIHTFTSSPASETAVAQLIDSLKI